MYLVDTNIWLERLLDQSRSDEVGRFLDAIASDELLVSDFTFCESASAPSARYLSLVPHRFARQPGTQKDHG